MRSRVTFTSVRQSDGWQAMKESLLRNLIMAGTAGLFLTLGAAGASAQTIYQGDRPIYVAPEPMVEGR